MAKWAGGATAEGRQLSRVIPDCYCAQGLLLNGASCVLFSSTLV